MKKFIAFTLAETLIVIGVIGIVSALTLPNLNSSTGDKEKVAKVKKVYRDLTDAFGRAEAIYGPYDEWFGNVSENAANERVGERLTEFMKLSKNCKMDTNLSCEFNESNKYRFITADGSAIAIKGASVFSVDIDGPTKGNGYPGKDIFQFEIIYEDANKGIVPRDYYNETFASIANAAKDGDAGACATWIIRYDNADYLQIQSVSGSTVTCKNGNTMTESHPRCK